MTPSLLILFVFVLLHLPGLRRWPGGPSPSDKAAGAMGIFFFLPGVMHFTWSELFVEIMPPALPWPEGLVYASGVAELAIGTALLIPRVRRPAGWAAVLLLLAVWPANIYVAWSGNYPESFSQSPVINWIRVPFQLLYIGWAGWCALGHLPGLRFRRRMFASYYDKVSSSYEEYIAPRKTELFAGIEGDVLELGPGTGVNLRHLDTSVRWKGVEPNPRMRELLSAKAAERGIVPSFTGYTDAGLDVADESVDVVLSTLVLCSVPDPVIAVRDIHRVLKSGGRYVFIEHVAARPGTPMRRMQSLLRPLWQFLADGCCPDRELADAIRAGGFEAVELEEFTVPKDASASHVSLQIAGVATK